MLTRELPANCVPNSSVSVIRSFDGDCHGRGTSQQGSAGHQGEGLPTRACRCVCGITKVSRFGLARELRGWLRRFPLMGGWGRGTDRRSRSRYAFDMASGNSGLTTLGGPRSGKSPWKKLAGTDGRARQITPRWSENRATASPFPRPPCLFGSRLRLPQLAGPLFFPCGV